MKLQTIFGEEIANSILDAVRTVSQEVAHEEPPTELTSPEQVAARLALEYVETLEALGDEYVEAGKILMTTLKALAKSRDDIQYDQIMREIEETGQHMDVQSFNALAEDAASGDPLLPTPTFSHATWTSFSTTARYLLEQNAFSDAMKVFSLLCGVHPNDCNSWVGYGHAAFHCDQYDIATLSYYIAASLCPTSPWPCIWAANVCEKTNDLEGARDLLQRAHELLLDKGDPESVALARDISERLKGVL